MLKKSTPVAPPVYRPQPTPRVLQTKQAIHKGLIGPNAPAITSVRPQTVRPGAPAVKSAAPPVYRPNPQPQVLQRRTAFQPAKPPGAISVHMKAQAAVPRPRVTANPGVVQRVVVIKKYGDDNEQRTFTVKKSKSKSTYHKSTDLLIRALKKAGLTGAWKGHLRTMVGAKPPTPNYEFNTLQDLVDELAKTFPLMSENKKRKREEKNKILEEHKTNLQNIKSKYESPGKKMRTGSFVGSNKLITKLSETDMFKQNIDDLVTTSSPTKKGKSLELNTGNIFQSQLALSLANLDNDVKGAYLDNNYVRVNDGLGTSEGIREEPFIEIPTRLKKTVVYGDGAYRKDETVGEDLFTFENIRLPENTVSSQLRHLLVQDGKLKDTEEFNPVGPYALSEIPKATKGEKQNNRLMNQNAYKIFDQVRTVDGSTVIGRNAGNLPQGTNVSTLRSYRKSYKRVTVKHTKKTQNEFHKQNFYIARAMSGVNLDTPPGSPLNQDYNYDDSL